MKIRTGSDLNGLSGSERIRTIDTPGMNTRGNLWTLIEKNRRCMHTEPFSGVMEEEESLDLRINWDYTWRYGYKVLIENPKVG